MNSGCSSMGLDSLADLLTLGQDVPVIDETGLDGNFYYSFRSQFSPDFRRFGVPRNEPNPNLPTLSTALNEQLGLKLESRRGPVDMLVVDSVQQPTEN